MVPPFHHPRLHNFAGVIFFSLSYFDLSLSIPIKAFWVVLLYFSFLSLSESVDSATTGLRASPVPSTRWDMRSTSKGDPAGQQKTSRCPGPLAWVSTRVRYAGGKRALIILEASACVADQPRTIQSVCHDCPFDLAANEHLSW